MSFDLRLPFSRSGDMKVEAKLKRTPSRNIAESTARLYHHFPSLWNPQCFAYGNLKRHLQVLETKELEGICNSPPTQEWECALSTMMEVEVNKISSFYEERYHECTEGLTSISSEITTVCCTTKSAGAIQAWHEFIIQFNSKAKKVENHEGTPDQFITAMEAYLLLMVGKSIDQTMLSVVKKLVYILKLSLNLKCFTQFNIAEIKRLLRSHDETTTTSICTEWLERMHRETFSTCDPFEKTMALTKDLVRSFTPSADDFVCPICLGLLCEPVAIQCGHRFCDYCLAAASASCSFCPMCRMEQQLHPSNHMPDKHLNQYLRLFFPSDYKASLREHKNMKQKPLTCTLS